MNSEKELIHYEDWLLILGIIAIPLDSIRFIGKIGISELSVAIWGFLDYLRHKKIKNSIFTPFWCFFFSSIIIGTFIGVIIAPEESTYKSSIPIYIFFFYITVCFYNRLSSYKEEYIIYLLETIGVLSGFFYCILYFIASNRQFSGIIFWHYTKFTGGAENPNKLSVYMGQVIFILLFVIQYHSKNKHNNCLKHWVILRFIATVLCCFVGIKTEASMFYVCIIGGLIVVIICNFISSIKLKRDRVLIFLESVIVLVIIGMLLYEPLYNAAYNWISKDSNGLGRFELFKTITYTLNKSWLFGLGPGLHAAYGHWSYHNSYLEILAMCGVVGLTIFLVFICTLVKKCLIDVKLLSLIAPLLIYSMGNFSVRTTEFWFVSVVIYVFAEKKAEKTTFYQ